MRVSWKSWSCDFQLWTFEWNLSGSYGNFAFAEYYQANVRVVRHLQENGKFIKESASGFVILKKVVHDKICMHKFWRHIAKVLLLELYMLHMPFHLGFLKAKKLLTTLLAVRGGVASQSFATVSCCPGFCYMPPEHLPNQWHQWDKKLSRWLVEGESPDGDTQDLIYCAVLKGLNML